MPTISNMITKDSILWSVLETLYKFLLDIDLHKFKFEKKIVLMNNNNI